MHDKRIGALGFHEEVFRPAFYRRNPPPGKARCKARRKRHSKIGPPGYDLGEALAL
jgi:hypothetical protein